MKQDHIDAPHNARLRTPALLQQSLLLASLGAYECDLRDDSLCWTDGVYDLFGLPRGVHVARGDIVAMYAEESREEMQRLRTDAIARKGRFRMDARIFTTAGEERWMRLTGEVLGRRLHGLKQDITDERRQLDRIRSLAENDALTGLASRAMFNEQFLDAGDPRPLAALVLIDMDGLKRINDRFGHPAGDACLRHMGAILHRMQAPGVRAVRIGGDEFAVLIDPPQLKTDVIAFVRKLREVLGGPVMLNDHIMGVGASFGIAMPSDPARYDPQKLFHEADRALYEAKRAGRNAARLFVPTAF